MTKEKVLASSVHFSMPLVTFLVLLIDFLPELRYYYLAPFDAYLFGLISTPWFPTSPIFCGIIWLIYRKCNSWISFNADQALKYQLFTYVLYYLMIVILILGAGAPFLVFWLIMLSILFLFLFLFFAYPTYAAIRTFKGQEFKYLLIGKLAMKKQ